MSTQGLIDTGASQCCIDISIAARLQLVRSDQTELIGVGGAVDANVYHAVLEIPKLRLRREIALFAPIDHAVPSGVLIGRNVLSDFVVVYEGPEQCFYFYAAGQDPHDDYDDYAS